jgi:hypothetical protein
MSLCEGNGLPRGDEAVDPPQTGAHGVRLVEHLGGPAVQDEVEHERDPVRGEVDREATGEGG